MYRKIRGEYAFLSSYHKWNFIKKVTMGKGNLGLKITFKKGEAILFFDKEEEKERAVVNELAISVKDDKGGASTLRLNKAEAFNLAKRVLVGAITLEQIKEAPEYSTIVVASRARLLDDEVDKLLGDTLKVF